MISTALSRVISSAASFASRIGSPSTDMVHVLLALLDEAEVKSDLRNRGVSHSQLRDGLLKILDGREPNPPQDSRLKLSPLTLLTVERALAKNHLAGPREVLDELWEVDLDMMPDFEAVALLRRAAGGMQEPLPETIARYCTDLVEQARAGRIDPVIGREDQIGRVQEILGRRKKNNPILLGEPGVGKTAVVEGLALRIADGEAEPALSGMRILSLDVGALVGGTRNRGDFEERLTALVSELSTSKSFVLFVDEVHTLVGATSGATDAANLLKPALQSGAIRCIGATTHGEYAKYFDADPAMARRFQPVVVPEPTRSEAVDIITRLLPTYSGHHGVAYPESVAASAVDLSTRYVLTRHLPDKAIDVIDEAGAIASARRLRQVTEDIIHEVVTRMSGVKTAHSLDDGGFAERLADKVKGQPEAVLRIARAVVRANAGLGRDGRARCALLFAGPDGSGKRFAAAEVARLQGLPVHRFDMSEYREHHTVSRLVGSPPGYVGYGAGGQLTEAVRRNPTCVVFLDRIDLAHPNVAAIVVQAIETGMLTDSSGRQVSFSGATVIMTAVEEAESTPIGFRHAGREEREFAGSLDSEVVECADAVVRFRPLDEKAMQEIAEAKLGALADRLLRQGVGINAAPEVAAAVAAQAASAGGGGKAIDRAFRRLVEDPLLDTALAGGACAMLTARDGRIEVRALKQEAATA